MATSDAPVEAGHVLIFARSLGDVDPRYGDQLYVTPGSPLITPPTFVRALDHFDPESTTRPTLPRQEPGRGGRRDTVHAEQHFEYVAPFRAGDRVTVESFPGEKWTKDGRSGRLEFTETVTEYRNQDGTLLVRARKVSVRTAGGEPRG
jgi:hypothetical protein